MISTDNAPVPLFKRHYRDSLSAIKNRLNVVTALDANRDALARRLGTNPALVQAQFLALSFNNIAELRFAADRFIQVQGDTKQGSDAASSAALAQFAAAFPTAADREWLRLFLLGLNEESDRFYNAEYQRAVSARQPVFAAVDSLWTKVYRARFERFLNNTNQRNGQLVLSLPLGGEGRTGAGKDRQTVIAVTFPGRPADAIEAIFVFAHEAVGNIVSTVVSDNTRRRSNAVVSRRILCPLVRCTAVCCCCKKSHPIWRSRTRATTSRKAGSPCPVPMRLPHSRRLFRCRKRCSTGLPDRLTLCWPASDHTRHFRQPRYVLFV